jgi:hypothetical protein
MHFQTNELSRADAQFCPAGQPVALKERILSYKKQVGLST